MKTFIAKQEIRDLLNKVIMDEVSFTRMVEIMNERVSERVRVSEIMNERVNKADKKCVEDIPVRKFKKGDKVMLKSGRKSIGGLLYLTVFDLYIGDPLTVSGYTESGNVFFDGFGYKLDEDWLEPYVEPYVEQLKKVICRYFGMREFY